MPNIFPSLIIFLFSLFLDHLVKYSVISQNLFYYKNSGLLFGLVSFGDPVITILLANVITALILFYMFRNIHTNPRRIKGGFWKALVSGLPLFLAGSVSNITDRIMQGYVVDYLDWQKILSFWPQDFVRFFNLADVFIVVGLVLMLIQLVFIKPHKI